MPSRSRSPYGPLRGGTCACAEVTAANGAARVPIARMARRTRFMFVSTVCSREGASGPNQRSVAVKVARFRVQPPAPLGRCARTFARRESSYACKQARPRKAERLERQAAERQAGGEDRRFERARQGRSQAARTG